MAEIQECKEEDKKKIDFKHNMKIYWSLLKKYKLVIAVFLFLVFVLEGTRVVNDFLFKVIIDKGTEFLNKTITSSAYIHILMIIAGVFILNIIIKAITKWFHMHILNRFEGNLIMDLKRKFFEHLVQLSHSFHTSHKTGSLISRLIRGGSAIERMTDVFAFNVFPLLFQLVIIGGSLLYFDTLSAIIAIIMVILFIAYSLIINHIQQASTLALNDAEDSEKANISDIFTNIDSIKYFGKEKNIKEKYAGIAERTRKALIRNWDYYRALDVGQSIIIGAGTFFIIYFPVMRFLNGEISTGTLIFIYTVFGNLFGNLWGFVHGIRNYYRAMAEFESLFQYAKIEQEVKDATNAKELKVKKGSIEFKHVSFSYKKRAILDSFSLKIPRNKKIALVGPSGAGKSTAVKLLYRLYDVEKGEILVDGQNIKSLRQESLRSELSIVPQECVLFDDTIYNNIAFSNPNAKKKEVFQAMKFAQLYRIVETFPNKENTIVGERGVKLSGGEKQRVSIARAILANKKILVLDEATSSLDSETEHEIQAALHNLMKGRTSIIIAHRLSTIMSADMIIVMDKGRIIQKGTHKQLITKEGLYRKLWNLQKGGYIR
ncbi:ABC transporter ATP-binding protein [Candidatus Woesearchaeota archaeon]|nr:ABC transporter ATP-binding protein [Candidatus Woesearchaeota archaeon]